MCLDIHDRLARIGVHHQGSIFEKYGDTFDIKFYIIHAGQVKLAQVGNLTLGTRRFIAAILENSDCICMSASVFNKYFQDKSVAQYYLKKYEYRIQPAIDYEKVYKDIKNFISKKKV